MEFQNKKVVVVFGASGTVGSTFARCMQRDHPDWKLVLVGKDEGHLKKISDELNVHCMCKDATDPKQVEDVFNMHKDEGICAIVNVIGDFDVCRMGDMDLEHWQCLMSHNVLPAFNILKSGCKVLSETSGGSICCVAAAVVEHGIKNHEAWAAAKAAVAGMYRSAAASFVHKNVRINCVAPGLVHGSPISMHLVGEHDELLKKWVSLYPMQRIAEPEEVARAIEFFITPQACFMTGECLPVDGGLSSLTPHVHTPHMAGAAMMAGSEVKATA